MTPETRPEPDAPKQRMPLAYRIYGLFCVLLGVYTLFAVVVFAALMTWALQTDPSMIVVGTDPTLPVVLLAISYVVTFANGIALIVFGRMLRRGSRRSAARVSHALVAASVVQVLFKLMLQGADVTLVGPPTFLVDDPDYYGVPQTSDLDAVIPEMDVVYMLRVQLERMEGAAIPSRREYNRLWGLDMSRVAKMRPEAIICHPGPMNRGMEINADVADCARSRILDQVNAGVLTRMAEMYLLLGGENNGVSA